MLATTSVFLKMMAATIVVAQTTEERGALSRQIFLYSLAPLVLTFLVGAVLSMTSPCL